MKRLLPAYVAVAGIVARLYVSTLGYTQDLSFWQGIITKYHTGGAQAMMADGPIHFGPVFPSLLLAASYLPLPLGTTMALLLTLIDLAVAWMLWRWVSLTAAALFFLCPVTIIVSGYQRLPEGFAVGLGLAAVLMLDRRPLIAAALLGLSLAAKHELLLLPIWLSIRKGGGDGIQRFLCLVIPYGILIAAFLPFPGLAWKVIHYHSTNNFPLWSALNIGNILGRVPATYLFGGSLLLLGLVFRRRSPLELYCCYCCALVAFSSALANHYLAIPVIGLACAWRRA